MIIKPIWLDVFSLPPLLGKPVTDRMTEKVI